MFRRRLSNGDIRFAVRVRVGGPIEAMLDTGSSGPRVMAGALTPAQSHMIGIARV